MCYNLSETGSHVAQDGPELVTSLTPPPKHCDYRHLPPTPTNHNIVFVYQMISVPIIFRYEALHRLYFQEDTKCQGHG